MEEEEIITKRVSDLRKLWQNMILDIDNIYLEVDIYIYRTIEAKKKKKYNGSY